MALHRLVLYINQTNFLFTKNGLKDILIWMAVKNVRWTWIAAPVQSVKTMFRIKNQSNSGLSHLRNRRSINRQTSASRFPADINSGGRNVQLEQVDLLDAAADGHDLRVRRNETLEIFDTHLNTNSFFNNKTFNFELLFRRYALDIDNWIVNKKIWQLSSHTIWHCWDQEKSLP